MADACSIDYVTCCTIQPHARSNEAMASLSFVALILLVVATYCGIAMALVSTRLISRVGQNALSLSHYSQQSLRPIGSWLFSTAQDLEEKDPGVVKGTHLRIVKYPHPSLRAENEEITAEELKDGSIAKLAKEMFLVMYAAEGVGLAAPQVGQNKRLMVYNPSGNSKKWLDEVIMVNPKIVDYSDGKDIETEGCLSFPDMDGKVERSKWIKVESLNIRGKKVKRKFTGWEARIFQHEYDHLDGVVYVDRLDEENRANVQPRLDELVEGFGEGGAL